MKFCNKKFEVDIAENVEATLGEFPVKFEDDKQLNSPAQNNVFDKGSGEHLDTEKQELFHRTVVQNLCVIKQDR